MKQFEYQISSEMFPGSIFKGKPDPKVVEEMQKMGGQGWELVEVVQVFNVGAQSNMVLFWKREKQSNESE
jgi:hypothetical protein